MLMQNSMRNPSALSRSISEWANKKLITIKDLPGLMLKLDVDFEVRGDGLLYRRANGALVNGDPDRMFATLVKSNVDDKSFGSYRSMFTPRTTTPAERDATKNLLGIYQGAGLSKDKLSELSERFVVDSGKLRKLDTSTGYISTDLFTPEDVLVKSGIEIDHGALDLNRRREKVTAWKMAQDLSLGEGEKTTKRLFDALEKINEPKYTPLSHDFNLQASDLKKKSLSHVAVLDESFATLQELQRAEGLQKKWLSGINSLDATPTNVNI
jgi:hypothetical protein